ncbi:hypothetical protein PISL3812_04408 [Talaromyces islandicus]|uniref:Uncharacterized protein n=1 Tax=Talaromyces islandicus TaxID=28573 RepID=A0A0U1LXI5_TALIS|nr:hypothetical protein PISL3812_04408 [Talaromyces islandicus]
MPRVKFIRPRPGEATPSEHESSYSDYEDNYPTTVPSNSSSGLKGREPERPAMEGHEEASTSNPSISTSSVTLVNPAAAQLPSQQTQVNATPLEIAVSGLLLGAPPSQNSFTSTAVPSEPKSDAGASSTISTSSKRQSCPRGGRRGGSQASQRSSTTSQEKQPAKTNKRKRQTSAMSPSQDPQAESSTAPPQKRSRTRKTATTKYDAGSSATADAKPKFNIFEAIIQHPHLVFHFAISLEVDDLVSVYAISKDFHDIVNTGLTTVIVAQAMLHAPTSAKIFPFRCYRGLCVSDPRVEMDQSRGQSRLVPSFRWLRMVCWREQVAKKITHLMTKEGLYLPWECGEAIKKLWFLMDIPDNRRRLGTVQNTELWTAADLFYAIMFLVRFDMRCTDPRSVRAHGGMRRLLMAQKSMSLLCRTLERTAMKDFYEVTQTFLRWKYEPPRNGNNPIYGVPRSEIGKLQYEGYGIGGSQVKLQRPDELVLKECIRRDMDIWEVLLEIIVWPAKVEGEQ